MQNLLFNTLHVRNCLLWIVPLLLCSGCEDIFEKDVSGEKITLVSPGDSVTVSTTRVEFRWEEIELNTQYRLQVAKGGFAAPERFYADTLLSVTNFTLELTPGYFQWRVRAENAAGKSVYAVRSFTVDSVTSLGQQVVELKSPANNAFFGTTSVLFRWSKLSAADDYRLEVRDGTWAGEPVFVNASITGDSLRVTLDEGTYAWAVRAQNDAGSTPFSQPRTLTIDRTAPNTSTAIFPDNLDIVGQFPAIFRWSRPSDSGSAVSDSLYITFENGAPIPGFTPVLVSADQFEVEDLPTGNLMWWLKPIDAAGNAGTASTAIRFVAQ